MGQTLSEPITAKESSSLQNKFMKVGSSSMQGWRISMEDAHTHILTMADDKDASFFAGKLVRTIHHNKDYIFKYVFPNLKMIP